ncbi:2-dehydro-3-deoxyglucarate aldolase [Amycolatopsis orientalis]|uniref:2-dehydro-3-deoxyglucarate aldolase n=1 Tax=Amycolatopsis orientalis TaxID=31958 RepID=A0A193C0L2_AMYOR|nr:HpcH/HpaI aldolase/citrate lyase family protein [Amycolatopsis orientalis]ANN18051.1 2-dehydro-3-deoxyglucarate aldolase [Amycolatopsis orientalis]
MPLRLAPTFRARLAESARPLIGMWVTSGSPVVAEICAGSGLGWLLVDTEHSPAGLETVESLLRTIAAYPITPMVRAPSGDPVALKQLLDLGAQNVLVPMVDSAEQAEAVVRAVRYPPRGVRGVGSALSRSARWNRVEDYLTKADEFTSLFVQIESTAGVADAAKIAAVDGVDGVFVGPSDLAASMGLLGQQTHPDVTAAVLGTFEAVRAQGKPVGVNAFDPAQAQRYLDAGASFVLVGADVTLLAQGSEALARRHPRNP